MLGGKNRGPLGYTIVEVMIVLAISGVMFIIAANFINGKQARAAFSTGINDTASRLQAIIEQVNNGQYSDVNINCSFASGQVSLSPLSPKQQGTNSPCVFMGKYIYFSYDGVANSSPNYAVYSIVGGRVSGGNPITTPQAAGATVIDNPNLTTKETTVQSLTIKKVTINGFITGDYGIGFLQTPATDSSGTTLTNGGTTVNMYRLNLGPNQQEGAVKTRLIATGYNWIKTSTAAICLTDGTRTGEVQLGTSGGKLSVGVKIIPC